MNFKSLAKMGYEVFVKKSGEEMPSFNELPETIQNAWVAAAEEIVDVAVKAATA